MDEPPSYSSGLLLIHTAACIDWMGIGMLLFFLIISTLLSAIGRTVAQLQDDDYEFLENNKGQKLLVRYLRDHLRLTSTFLLARYLLLTGITLLCYRLFVIYVGGPVLLIFCATAIISLFLGFVSFVCSRMLVSRSSRLLLVTYAPLITALSLFFLPFSFLYAKAASFFNEKSNTLHPAITMDELSRALDLTENAHTNSEDHKLLKGIVTFGNMDITRIMKPKMDIIAVDFQTGFAALIRKILESGYSRIPVYRENLDHIVGVLYIKDLISHLKEPDAFNWQSLLRPCFFITENTKPDDLLGEFQHKKTHLAIIVDEFGQTAGLVTLEDIIEEIVGEINDEFDDDEIAYSKLDDQNYIFEGKTSMNDFLRIIGRSEESISQLNTDADTLSGFVIERAGRFPAKNEKVNWENFTFNIEAADSRRIKRLKVTIRKPA